MKQTLEKLWNDYLADECAAINSDEERKLAKITLELHEKVNSTLNEAQKNAVEEYIDALFDVEAIFLRKAFLKGCEFAVSFIFEAMNYSSHPN